MTDKRPFKDLERDAEHYVPYVPVRKRKEARLEQHEEQRRRERREPTPPVQPDAPKVGPRAKISLLDQAAELQKEAKGMQSRACSHNCCR